jgi:penicillin-binding protein 1A
LPMLIPEPRLPPTAGAEQNPDAQQAQPNASQPQAEQPNQAAQPQDDLANRILQEVLGILGGN